MAAPMQVPDRVLAWLHSSLQREYRDVNRTYSDTARTLSVHPYLQPSTDVYTSEDGSSALLLHLKGLLPVDFRGTTYRFPVSIWIPHSYPYEPPMLYVTASQDLAIRPGQHVSVEGRVYHPYLAQWSQQWDRASIVDCVGVMQSIFSKEPPLVARGQQMPNGPRPTSSSQQGSSAMRSPGPPPPPPKPPEADGRPVRSSSLQHARHGSEGPPLPPKPGQSPVQDRRISMPPAQSPGYSRDGPPLPPPPKPGAYSASHRPQSSLQHQYHPTLQSPTPQHWQQQAPHTQHQQQLGYGQPPPGPPQQHFPPQQNPFPQTQRHSQQYQQQPQPHPLQQSIMQQPPQPKAAPLDLLSLDDALPQAQPLPVPAVPPNPEKDALLSAISTQLQTLLHQSLQQNNAAIPALQAQQSALHHSLSQMSSELQQLQQMSETISSNEKILQSSTAEADRAIADAGKQKLPNIDELLVAPTRVGEQLYRVVAEIRGIEEALFAVAKALERGRVEPSVFARVTRSLAREQFLLKALERRIARGLGLEGRGVGWS